MHKEVQTLPEAGPKEALEKQTRIKEPDLPLRLRSLLFSVILARMCGQVWVWCVCFWACMYVCAESCPVMSSI